MHLRVFQQFLTCPYIHRRTLLVVLYHSNHRIKTHLSWQYFLSFAFPFHFGSIFSVYLGYPTRRRSLTLLILLILENIIWIIVAIFIITLRCGKIPLKTEEFFRNVFRIRRSIVNDLFRLFFVFRSSIGGIKALETEGGSDSFSVLELFCVK